MACTLAYLAPRHGGGGFFETFDARNFSGCVYGIRHPDLLDELKIGKTRGLLINRFRSGLSQLCFGFDHPRECHVDFVLKCDAPDQTENAIKVNLSATNVRAGRGFEYFVVPDRTLISTIFGYVNQGRAEMYVPHKNLLMRKPGDPIVVALKEGLNWHEMRFMVSPCLADFGSVQIADKDFYGIYIWSLVPLSLCEYRSRNSPYAYFYWDLSRKTDDHMYLLKDVRGLGVPDQHKEKFARNLGSPVIAFLEVKEYFDLCPSMDLDLVRLQRRRFSCRWMAGCGH